MITYLGMRWYRYTVFGFSGPYTPWEASKKVLTTRAEHLMHLSAFVNGWLLDGGLE